MCRCVFPRAANVATCFCCEDWGGCQLSMCHTLSSSSCSLTLKSASASASIWSSKSIVCDLFLLISRACTKVLFLKTSNNLIVPQRLDHTLHPTCSFVSFTLCMTSSNKLSAPTSNFENYRQNLSRITALLSTLSTLEDIVTWGSHPSLRAKNLKRWMSEKQPFCVSV